MKRYVTGRASSGNLLGSDEDPPIANVTNPMSSSQTPSKDVLSSSKQQHSSTSQHHTPSPQSFQSQSPRPSLTPSLAPTSLSLSSSTVSRAKSLRAAQIDGLSGSVKEGGSVASRDDKESRLQMFQDLQASTLVELEEIKLETMFRMVEDVTVNIGGRSVSKKLLYLSNNQASMLSHNSDSMAKVFNALELKNPNFVIKLLTSLAGKANHVAHIESPGDIKGVLRDNVFEVSVSDSAATERQIIKFMNDCILPLALQTRALVIISAANDCSLAVAAERVLGPVALRLGDECPFTVLGFGYLTEFHRMTFMQPDCLAGQVRDSSTTWKGRSDACHLVYKNVHGENLEEAECLDVNSACTVYVIFEGIDFENSKESFDSCTSFDNSFMASMIRAVPTVCISTQLPDMELTDLVDLVYRGVPVLLLDARERWPLLDSKPGVKAATDYAVQAASLDNPLGDMLEVSNPLRTQQNSLDEKDIGIQLVGSKSQLSAAEKQMRMRRHSGLPETEKRNQLSELSEVARDILKRGFSVLEENGDSGKGVKEAWTISTVAFLHGVMKLISSNQGKGHQHHELWLGDAIADLKQQQQESRGMQDLTESDNKLADLLCSVYFAEYPPHVKKASMKGLSNFISSFKGRTLDAEDAFSVQKAEDELESLSKDDDDGEDPNEWLALHSLLTSKHTFSESLYDLEGINKVLGDVAKIDRLPSTNTLEGSLLLQNAWDCVDYYHAKADLYKKISKATYVAMIFLGVAVVACGVVRIAYPDTFSNSQLSSAILVLSLSSTVATAYQTYHNPALRWQQLRAAALEIQSEIWVFRTRSGKYRASDERKNELAFRNALTFVQDRILESADLKKTNFYGTEMDSFAKHNQHYAKPGQLSRKHVDGCDNHHSPQDPESYIRKRLKAESKFYADRIPRYNAYSSISQSILILGSLSQSALAYTDQSSWAALVSSIVAGVGSWMIFGGTRDKMERYSNTFHTLKALELWWRSLPHVEQQSVANIDHLISSSEEILKAERCAWFATAVDIQTGNAGQSAQEEVTKDSPTKISPM